MTLFEHFLSSAGLREMVWALECEILEFCGLEFSNFCDLQF